ncbi:LLM class flavin-dependent oxidoreductase [Sinorhizobium medicae]|nr:LLM class flavin-dependent oxidoreductase [Sinorhizobium medicae]
MEPAHRGLYRRKLPGAIDFAARSVDVFALWGQPENEIRSFISTARQRAGQRDIEFSASFRIILGDTEASAWRRVAQIEETARAVAKAASFAIPLSPLSEGARRMRSIAARGDVIDDNIWTGYSALCGGHGNTFALVGTPEQVALKIRVFNDLGVRKFLLRGFDTQTDIGLIGSELLPLLRAPSLSQRSFPRSAEGFMQ